MMQVTTAVIGLLLSATTVPTIAATPGLIIKGRAGCGYWTAQRNIHDSAAVEQLVVGYLDGLSFARHVPFWQLGDLDNESVFAWIDNYCAKGGNTVIEGANQLFKQRTGSLKSN